MNRALPRPLSIPAVPMTNAERQAVQSAFNNRGMDGVLTEVERLLAEREQRTRTAANRLRDRLDGRRAA